MVKRIISLFVVFIFLTSGIIAKDLRKKAEESPLDCALYLLSNDRGEISPFDLSLIFFEVGRYDDAFRTLDFFEDDDQKLSLLLFISARSADKGNRIESARFLNKTYEVYKQNKNSLDESVLIFLAPSLIKLGKTEEVFSLIDFAEDYDKSELAIEISKEFYKANQPENAVKILQPAYITATTTQKAKIIELYARYNWKEKAEQHLAKFAPTAIDDEEELYVKRSILSSLINANLALGKPVHALELWRQYGETDDKYDKYGLFKLIDSLLEFNQRDKAVDYLSRFTFNPEHKNYYGYEFQNTLIRIADKFIAGGNNDLALKTLDIAYQFARQHGESHGLTSVGYTELTIKIDLLRQIKESYFKLKRFDKTEDIINAFAKENGLARGFFAETLADSAKRQIKTLPRREIDKIIAKAQSSVSENTGKYIRTQVNLSIAEVYAQMGEKNKAVELLTEALTEELSTVNKEICCYNGDFLLKVGKIFEQNNLKADSNMKKVLRELLQM